MRRIPVQALALLVAALATLGTSLAPGAWSITQETAGPAATLTPELPEQRFTVVLTVTPSDAALDQRLEGTVFFEATAFWTPVQDPGVVERPEFTISIAPEGGSTPPGGLEQIVLSERERTTLSVSAPAAEGCTDAEPCLERFVVTLSRGGAEPQVGTVDVTWTASVDLWGSEGEGPPPGLSVGLAVE